MPGVAVLGPGGVGGFLAAALARAGERVCVIAREETAATIAHDGIEVQSRILGDFTARPAAAAALTEPVEVLFVATKATGLAAALDRVEIPPEIVVPLLNGLDHLELLRARLGAGRVAAAVIRIESDRPAPGRILQSSPVARVDLAASEPELAAKLPAVVGRLQAAGLTARIGRSEAHVMWSKLVRLNAIASTTAASGRPLGELRSDAAWRPRLLACVEEGTAVANAEGGEVSAEAGLAELQQAHASLTSSMQRDLDTGRTPELDAIQGSVLRASLRHGIACPVIAELTRMIAARAGIPAPDAATE